MLEITGDMFEFFRTDAICITTNGILRKNGSAVMGKGIALEAIKRFPGIEIKLGDHLKTNGNVVGYLGKYTIAPQLFKPYEVNVVSFPTKDHWKDPSKLNLIEESAKQLITLTDNMKWGKVVLPRPGCGNGQLQWEDMKDMLHNLLDDRFLIVDKK